MYSTKSTSLLIGLTFAAEALSLPLFFSTSEDARTATALSSTSIRPNSNSREAADNSDFEAMPLNARRIPLPLAAEDTGTTQQSPRRLLPHNALPLLPRDAVPSVPADPVMDISSADNTDSCGVAVGILRADFAGHGLPLTSLVIESSTLVLLAGFVLYFFLWRYRIRARSGVYVSSGSTPVSLSFSRARRNSVVKHTPPTPAQPSHSLPPIFLSKIDEDSLPPTPTYGSPPVYSHASTLSPLRAAPSSPIRSVCRSPSLGILSGSGSGSTTSEGHGLEKKSSFLSLKD